MPRGVERLKFLAATEHVPSGVGGGATQQTQVRLLRRGTGRDTV